MREFEGSLGERSTPKRSESQSNQIQKPTFDELHPKETARIRSESVVGGFLFGLILGAAIMYLALTPPT